MWKSTFAAILLAVLLAGPSTAQQNQVKPAAAAETLQTMLKAQVFGPEWLLSKGLSGDLDVRNWRRLAQKLATAGSKIKIVAFGGSVTAGHLPEARRSDAGLADSSVSSSSTCWYKHVPGDADLILIEYSANGCTELQCTSIISPLVADYESLMRRVIRRAPNAALMSMAIFAFISQTITARNGEPVKLPYPWFATGEDMHGMLARRYGVPLVSVRDALYDVMWDDAALKSRPVWTRFGGLGNALHPFQGAVSSINQPPPSHDDDAAGYSATEIAAGRAQYSDDNNSNHRVTNQPRKPFGSGSDLPLPQPVTAHRRCLVRVTILHKTTSGGRLFKVDGVAVVPYTDARPMTSIDRMALRGGAV
ncbi:hypothetical protein COO60DRAFT_1520697 [Scenedesmus sp. NREL 46B-D3]|nr:hypothetical protein COO60DRAFT_1520697 [Scenedesmus sp. NREL 46B-D3]